MVLVYRGHLFVDGAIVLSEKKYMFHCFGHFGSSRVTGATDCAGGVVATGDWRNIMQFLKGLER